MTTYLQTLLRKCGYFFSTTAEKEVVRTIKEKTCYLSMNPVREEHDFYGEDYVLPDGTVLKVRLPSLYCYYFYLLRIVT